MAVSAACEETGVTLKQYRMLLKLVDGPLRAGVLARLSGTTRATLSTLTRNLEQRGLVIRVAAHDDGRGTNIGLTKAGRAAVQRADKRVEQLLVDLASGPGLHPFLELLDQLRDPVDRVSNAYKLRNLERSQAGRSQLR
jgi:DNA-binding MarR family transcriptional regulator